MTQYYKPGATMGDWTIRNTYTLSLLTLSYVFGEIAHFLITTTSKDVAQDLHYGDQVCFTRDNVTKGDEGIITDCKALETEADCQKQGGDCEWDYNGQGYAFQVLVGPAFVVTFSTSMLVMGLLLDNFSRPVIFSLGSLVFGASCLGMGLSNSYWLLVVLRVGIALGEAVCRPAASSLVADMFGPSSRATANGIFSLGIYLGYGLSFIFGLYLTDADVLGYSWRFPYILGGVPGIVISLVIFATIRDPRREEGNEDMQEVTNHDTRSRTVVYLQSLKVAFLQPAMVFLVLAAVFRHMAGLGWANNNVNYFSTYYPDTDIGYWLFICSMVGGSSGVLFGGLLTDFVQRRLGLHSRLWIQTVFLLLALPFSVLTIYLSPPYCFIALMTYYFFAETWFAILFTVITEIVPPETRAFCVAVFLFLMNMVAGNLVILVRTAGESLGLRTSLYIFFPGCLAVSAVLFFITSIPLWRESRRQGQ